MEKENKPEEGKKPGEKTKFSEETKPVEKNTKPNLDKKTKTFVEGN